jgi:transcriptional regulator with XRE-family HTH domain
MDEALELVARRLRIWRDEAELTLQQLAERSGVATSTIQKIETQQMVPTIAVLLKIAAGLGKSAVEFLSRDDATYQVHHSTPATHRVFGDGKHIRVERLVGDLQSPELEVWRVHCAGSDRIFRPGIHHHGEVLVVCETGAMEVHVEGKAHELRPGDTLHFKADLDHGWYNHPDVPASFLLIGHLPPILRAAMEEPRPATPRRDTTAPHVSPS